MIYSKRYARGVYTLLCVCSYVYVSSRKCKRLQPLGNFMFQR